MRKCGDTTGIIIFSIRPKTPYNITIDSDIPDFFLFCLEVNVNLKYVYIIPKQALVDNRVIGNQFNK